ncbi:MAG TPA: succinate dehydrogenase [Crocinitomicaceae bacterium]|nr:succinate dehydrogenase [Flavobacteriales bacterium]HBW86679.1 succinate dehydrogenase [Crocinitomicaceae bacterium]
MSNSALIKSSIAKKYWMAVTGLFLCLFLVGHLLGNLQLIMKTGEEGRRAFNEYAYFMGHNIFIKIMSYITYASIIFHAVDGILLTIQNKKARPVNYVYNNPSANSSLPSRWMAILGSLILVFIVTHMANFWWKMKISEEIPLHTYYSQTAKDTVYYTLNKKQISVKDIREKGKIEGEKIFYSSKKFNASLENEINQEIIKARNQAEQTGQNINPLDIEKFKTESMEKYSMKEDELIDEGYKDLHTVVMQFFNKDKNPRAIFYLIIYVISMGVLAFHLWHGFASAFQSLGLNHAKYNILIKKAGQGFAVIIPLLFALIPILIFIK